MKLSRVQRARSHEGLVEVLAATRLDNLVPCGRVYSAETGSKASHPSTPPGESILTGPQLID